MTEEDRKLAVDVDEQHVSMRPDNVVSVPPSVNFRFLDAQPVSADVQRLSLKPGDVVVLSVDTLISAEAADHLRSMVAKSVPGHQVLVLCDGLRIGVLDSSDVTPP